MDQKKMIKQMLDFNHATFNNVYESVALLQDQFEDVAKNALDQSGILPADGRKAIESWSEVLKTNRKNIKKQIDKGFEQAEKLIVI